MTAPAPSPYEQEQIDRFGIFAEERVVEEVARATVFEDDETDALDIVYAWLGGDRAARTLLTRPEYDALVASIAQALADRSAAVATQDGGAEEAVRRVEALIGEADAKVRQSVPASAAEKIVAVGAHSVLVGRLRAALAPQAGDGAR